MGGLFLDIKPSYYMAALNRLQAFPLCILLKHKCSLSQYKANKAFQCRLLR